MRLTPRLSAPKPVYAFLVQPEGPCQLNAGKWAAANCQNFGLRELSVKISDSFGGSFGMDPQSATITPGRATLGITIACVVGGGSKEKMIGVNTKRNVTLVTDEKLLGNRAISQEPRKVVRPDVSAVKPNRTVAIPSLCPEPKPAHLGASVGSYPRPESPSPFFVRNPLCHGPHYTMAYTSDNG